MQLQLLDTLEGALVDYVSDIQKGQNIQISKSLLSLLYNIYNIKEGIEDLDIWISDLKDCIENSDNSISACVSKSFGRFSKKVDELNQKAIDFFKALKDKFEFFRPPEERTVTREPDNVIRYLRYVEGIEEDKARSILENWVQKGLVEIVQNQVILKQAQGGA